MTTSRNRRREQRRRLIASAALSTDDVAAARACADAEALGDASAALASYRRVSDFDSSFHGGRLEQLTELADRSPGWVWNRWITVQCRRPLWSDATAAEVDIADLLWALDTAYPHGPDPAWGPQVPPSLRDHLVVEHDWLVRQVLVHESRRFERFLDRRAGPRLLAGADDPERWVGAPMGGYRLEKGPDSSPGAVTVSDLSTGERRQVLDLGLSWCHARGEHLLGRVVPVADAPGQMFEWRPLPVDAMTARAVARDPDRWLQIVSDRVRARVLAPGFSYHEGEITSDAPELAWVYALLGEGWSDWLPRRDGLLHIEDAVPFAVDALLARASDAPEQLVPFACVLPDLLLRPDVDVVVRGAFCGRQHQTGWRTVAGLVREPAAERCRRWAGGDLAVA